MESPRVGGTFRFKISIGAAAIEKVRKTQPAAYMKICALLVPREMKLEHPAGLKP